MSDNGQQAPIPFQAPAGTPLVGQPITMLTVGVPINLTFTCNCGAVAARPVLAILNSEPATCPHCHKVYNAFFNPQNGQVVMQIKAPDAEQVPA